MFNIFLIIIMIIAVLLVVVVMVQNPKGGGLSSSFGGGGAQIGGVQKTNDFLDKSTCWLAVIMVFLILLSNVTLIGEKSVTNSKALEGANDQNIEAPISTTPVQTPAPTSTTKPEEGK